MVERSGITLPKPGSSDRSTTYVHVRRVLSDQRLPTVHGQSLPIIQVMSRYRLIDRLYDPMATYNTAPAYTQVCMCMRIQVSRQYKGDLHAIMVLLLTRPWRHSFDVPLFHVPSSWTIWFVRPLLWGLWVGCWYTIACE